MNDDPVADGPDDDEPAHQPGDQRRPRTPWWRWAIRAGLVIIGALAVYYLATLWWVHRVGQSDQARPVDAIVVMGAAQYDGRPSPQLRARLDHVVELWDRGLAPRVVTTGGNRPGDRFTEAQSSANYLVAHGVPESAIVEVGGSNSYESLLAARGALEAKGAYTVLLVSDPYHSARIRLIAQELGLVAYVSPTPTSTVRGSAATWREVKEAAGVAVGRVIGFDRLSRLVG